MYLKLLLVSLLFLDLSLQIIRNALLVGDIGGILRDAGLRIRDDRGTLLLVVAHLLLYEDTL